MSNNGILTYKKWEKSIAQHYAGSTIPKDELREMYLDEMDGVLLNQGINQLK